eukprot:5449072-Amphidinium_carterae.1
MRLSCCCSSRKSEKVGNLTWREVAQPAPTAFNPLLPAMSKLAALWGQACVSTRRQGRNVRRGIQNCGHI